jgi:hypothetical protein
MRRLRPGEEPRERVGICCGERCRRRKSWRDVALYRVRESRYRCARCYKVEAGFKP